MDGRFYRSRLCVPVRRIRVQASLPSVFVLCSGFAQRKVCLSSGLRESPQRLSHTLSKPLSKRLVHTDFHRFPRQQAVAFSLVVVSKNQTERLVIR